MTSKTAKYYIGERSERGADVYVRVISDDNEAGREYQLPHHVRHSPTGFEWGYGGSGPGELARCILIDFFDGDTERADACYQDFKSDIIAPIKDDCWTISSADIEKWVDAPQQAARIAELEAVAEEMAAIIEKTLLICNPNPTIRDQERADAALDRYRKMKGGE